LVYIPRNEVLAGSYEASPKHFFDSVLRDLRLNTVCVYSMCGVSD
jgi:hypothetical protein